MRVPDGTTHGRRCSARPPPGRGSACERPAAARRRTTLPEMGNSGPGEEDRTRSSRPGNARRHPGLVERGSAPARGTTASRASSRIRSGSRHVGKPGQRLGGHDEPQAARAPWPVPPASLASGVDRVRRPRAIELDAADARTPGCRRPRARTIASRCPAAVTGAPSACAAARAPGRTARARGPASRAPPRRSRGGRGGSGRTSRRGCRASPARPARRRDGRAPALAQGAPSLVAPQRGSHSSSTAPIRTVSPGRIPALRSAASMPGRTSSRWNRSADSSFSKLVWAASRSMRLPRTRNAPSSRSTVNPSPAASSRWTTTPGGLRRRVEPSTVAAAAPRAAIAARRAPRPSSAEIATAPIPSRARASRNAGHASARPAGRAC